MTTMITIFQLQLLAILVALMAATYHASAQTLYPRAARVYLPRLRRLLSFGGTVNGQAQDVIVSLDLSKEWPTDNPLLTPLTTTLRMGAPATRAEFMIPVVARNGDTYDIMLYGGSTSDGTRGKRYMLSTKDGVTLDNVRSVALTSQDYTALIPTMSSVAIVLDEYFKDRSGAVGNAPSYFVGGSRFGNDSWLSNATVAALHFVRAGHYHSFFPLLQRQFVSNLWSALTCRINRQIRSHRQVGKPDQIARFIVDSRT
ncbi:hypothetical protein BCR44DRAFT_249425 [Catenaria anguillulae PL171]|uniref:Uncharacterized protein n=1 Tax=Catenaria anguillulae PL171 TaxID=765915 RepID=A0A1Y2H9C3_9FUNG|nr:hypothetical protein BCR44DRAFT_249425 [Catenaria anguillulae PL171]